MTDTKALQQGGSRAHVGRASTWCLRRPRSAVCNPVLDLDPPPDRPDPSIYSQAPLLASGTAATWDNPDIVLYTPPAVIHKGDAVPIPQDALVTVRNNSATAAAINTVVAVSYGLPGIGMPRTPLITQLVSLTSGETRQLSIPRPNVFALSMFVDLSNPYDADVTNNHGESCSEISRPAIAGLSPTQHAFRLGNVTADPITYNLSVEPNALGVTLHEQQVTVAPGSVHTVIASHGTLPPPADTSFTVVARDARGNLAGGFTWLLYFR